MNLKPDSDDDCRCDGTGTYTVSIPIADAVVVDTRPCPVHGRPQDRQRALVRDFNGRIGEVMDVRGDGPNRQIDLRPPGGGREWVADPAMLQPAQRPTVPHLKS